MNRKTAREIAVQLCFASINSEQSAKELVDGFFAQEHYDTLLDEDELFSQIPDDRQLDYIRNLVMLVEEKREEIDGYIEKYSRGWKVGRISKTALAILRCALCEILYVEDVPASAAINEAVELDKGYDEPDTVAFVNGVLGGFMKGEFSKEPEDAGEAPEE